MQSGVVVVSGVVCIPNLQSPCSCCSCGGSVEWEEQYSNWRSGITDGVTGGEFFLLGGENFSVVTSR